MAIILVIPNEDVNRTEKTRINASQTAVGKNIELENNQGFLAGDCICLGREGSEQSEMVHIDTVNADQKNIVLLDNTKFIHQKFDEVTKFLYNKRKIYRKQSGESSFSHLSTIDIEVDRPEGSIYEDNSGLSTSQYKATYYNSANGAESNIDDAKAVYGSGGDHYCNLRDVREEAGFSSNDNISDERIFRTRARSEGEISASLVSRYSLPIFSNNYFSDSDAQEILRQICMLLSAGWLLYQEYPDERGNGTDNDGLVKVKEARSMLKSVRDGSLVLLGSDNNPLTRVNTMSIEGYPDNSFSNIPDSNHDDESDHIFQLGKSW